MKYEVGKVYLHVTQNDYIFGIYLGTHQFIKNSGFFYVLGKDKNYEQIDRKEIRSYIEENFKDDSTSEIKQELIQRYKEAFEKKIDKHDIIMNMGKGVEVPIGIREEIEKIKIWYTNSLMTDTTLFVLKHEDVTVKKRIRK